MEEKNTIDLMELFFMFLRKWRFIVCVAIVVGAISFCYSRFLITPMYVSDGKLYITNRSTDGYTDERRSVVLSDLMLSQQLALTYAEVLNSKTFYTMVIEKSGLTYYTPNALENMVLYEPLNETEVMQVTVTTPSPQDSYLLVETILDCAPEEIERIVNGGTVKIIDRAEMPTGPVSPSVQKNTLTGILLGIILGCVIVFVRSLLDDSVKSAQELSENFGLPVLAEIPKIEPTTPGADS